MTRERKLEERVRYWVDPRFTSSERPPVRRKSNLLLGSDRWNNRYMEKKTSARGDQSVANTHGKETRTFFFRNFPEGCEVNILKSKFSEVGEVVDIFCPTKRDRTGKPFRFVRLLARHIRSTEVTLEKLNRLWIDSYKLCVYMPRFERALMPNNNKTQIRNRFMANLGVRSLEKTYKNAISKSGPKIQGDTYKESSQSKVQKDESFTFAPTVEEKSWLKNCWMGLLKNDFSWEDNREEIQGECDHGKNKMYAIEDTFGQDGAGLLLSVPFDNEINTTFSVRIGDHYFKIRIAEEYPFDEFREECFEDDESNLSGSMELNSSGPAMADIQHLSGESDEECNSSPKKHYSSVHTEMFGGALKKANCTQIPGEIEWHAEAGDVNAPIVSQTIGGSLENRIITHNCEPEKSGDIGPNVGVTHTPGSLETPKESNGGVDQNEAQDIENQDKPNKSKCGPQPETKLESIHSIQTGLSDDNMNELLSQTGRVQDILDMNPTIIGDMVETEIHHTPTVEFLIEDQTHLQCKENGKNKQKEKQDIRQGKRKYSKRAAKKAKLVQMGSFLSDITTLEERSAELKKSNGGVAGMDARDMKPTLEAKCKEVRELIKNRKIGVCFIQETKKEVIYEGLCFSMWGSRQVGWAYRAAVGRSGGILALWNTESFTTSSWWHMEGAVVVNGVWGSERIDCCLVNIYAACSLPEIIALWNRLLQVVVQVSDSCLCIAGYFNSVRRDTERACRNSSSSKRDVEAFDNFIRDA
ncbi:hypothetical protein ACS0TY_008006 [Phlomoides rotata]